MNSEVAAKRERWRAALCEYGAAALRADASKVSDSVRPFIESQAEQAEVAGAAHRINADVIVGIAAVKADRAAGLLNTAAYTAKVLELQALRGTVRASGAAGGTPQTVNNFSEPSDAELDEMEV